MPTNVYSKEETDALLKTQSDALTALSQRVAKLETAPPPVTGTPPPPPPASTTFPARGSVGVTTPKAQLPVTTPGGGGLVVNTAGAVIQNQYIKGGIDVNTPNVTIRNCYIEQQQNGQWFNIVQRAGATNLTVEDCTIIPTNTSPNGGRSAEAVHPDGSPTGLTMRRCEIAICSKAALHGNNVLLEDLWVHDLTPYPQGGTPHKEAFMSMGGTGITIRRCRFEVNRPDNFDTGTQTAAVFLQPWSDIVNVTIDSCFLQGGYYSLRAEDADPSRNIRGTVRNLSVTNNVFGPQPTQGGAPALVGGTVVVSAWSNNRVGDADGVPGSTVVNR